MGVIGMFGLGVLIRHILLRSCMSAFRYIVLHAGIAGVEFTNERLLFSKSTPLSIHKDLLVGLFAYSSMLSKSYAMSLQGKSRINDDAPPPYSENEGDIESGINDNAGRKQSSLARLFR